MLLPFLAFFFFFKVIAHRSVIFLKENCVYMTPAAKGLLGHHMSFASVVPSLLVLFFQALLGRNIWGKFDEVSS